MNGIFERFKQRPISKGKRNDRLSLWIEIFHPNVFFFSSGHVPCVPLKASREMFSRFSHSNIRNGMKTRTISCTLKCAVCNLKRPLKSFIACEVGNRTISAVTLYYRRAFAGSVLNAIIHTQPICNAVRTFRLCCMWQL